MTQRLHQQRHRPEGSEPEASVLDSRQQQQLEPINGAEVTTGSRAAQTNLLLRATAVHDLDRNCAHAIEDTLVHLHELWAISLSCRCSWQLLEAAFSAETASVLSTTVGASGCQLTALRWVAHYLNRLLSKDWRFMEMQFASTQHNCRRERVPADGMRSGKLNRAIRW